MLSRARSGFGLTLGLLVAASAAACTGDIGDGKDAPPIDPEAVCSAEAALEVPLQRINAAQFRQVVTDLFGDGLVFDDGFPVPVKGYAYSTYAAANPVADAQVKPIMETVEALAMQIADRVPACSGDETACASSYLTDLAARALRRPATEAEIQILLGIYTASRADMDHAEGVALAVSALLQMPQFLYLLEEVPLPGCEPRTLDGQEICTRA
jgi:hypothetical protein